MRRLFVAVPLSLGVRKAISPLLDVLRQQPGIASVAAENLHFTLHFLGSAEDAKLAQIVKQLKAISFSSFEIELQGVGAFPSLLNPTVVWIGVAQNQERLASLMKEVQEKLAFVRKEEYKDQIPHLTIARVKRKVDLSSFFAQFKEAQFGTMRIEKMVLYESVLTLRGPEYKVLYERTSSL